MSEAAEAQSLLRQPVTADSSALVGGGPEKHREFAAELSRRFRTAHIDSGRMHGATVVAVKGGELLYSGCFGGHDTDSVYHIFSLTKIVATVATLQQVDAGTISLDDPVAKYCPSFRRKFRVSDDLGASEACHEVDGQTLTIRHCLNHTAGFQYTVFKKMVKAGLGPLEKTEHAREEDASKSLDLKDFVESFAADSTLVFDPGTHFTYSWAHSIAARCVEIVSGRPFGEYVREQIAAPLGISSDGGSLCFGFPGGDRSHCPPMTINKEDGAATLGKLVPRRCRGCCVPFICCMVGCCGGTVRGHPSQLKVPPPLSRTTGARVDGGRGGKAIRGDMGLKSTAADLTKLLQMLCNQGRSADTGRQVLSAAALEQMASSSLPPVRKRPRQSTDK
jgi:CubicO group peptidase (beta-lactamase class C family)